jgi:PPIC-type PPIASE domain
MSFIQIKIAGLLLLASCSQPAATDAGRVALPLRGSALDEPLVAQASPPAAFVALHPRGAWRLANPDQLGNVVVWADQILIRHDAARNEVSFNLAYWLSVPPAPRRTRDQALALAQQIAAEAARAPSAFDELARRYSEDLPSRDEGGALGGLAVSQLSAWPQVLDALAALQSGQTSNVVETNYGLHIFRRQEPPPEQTLSGSHIVIGHNQAEWLKVQARGPLPARSRDEALRLASELYRQALARPERFQELVDKYSEHRDALLAGDFGNWSSREPNPFPARMRRLEHLAVGQVGAPIETHLGFEVILRTEARPREQYAMRAARLPFDPEAPETSESSRARVLAQAEAFARTYAAEPQRFGAPGELPVAPMQWESGRGVPGVDLQLAQLGLGEVAASPVQAEFSFQISQRTAPEPSSPEHYATELPTPAYPDVAYQASQMSPGALRELLRESDRGAQADLRLSAAQRARLRTLHDSPVLADASEPSEAGAAFERVLQQTQALLGRDGYSVYLSVLQRKLASVLLEGPGNAVTERGL